MRRMFAALFTVLMLAACACVAVFCVEEALLDSREAELNQALETAKGRERKQQSEYDAVVAAIPVAEASLSDLAPQAEAAQTEVTALKAERKTLRAEQSALTERLETLNAATETLLQERNALLGALLRRDAAALAEKLGVTP